MRLVDEARGRITKEHRPAGFNIGINDGRAAGQTVMHVHVHLIPRYPGDRTDPRGGVRWVLPDAADYWSPRT
jgi:diadenosine tetraphosphate (Ap4A) HIT family hydrolase